MINRVNAGGGDRAGGSGTVSYSPELHDTATVSSSNSIRSTI